MYDKNNCNPQFGQRRLAILGNGDGSKRFGCGMAHPLFVTGGSAIGLSVTGTPVGRAWSGMIYSRFNWKRVCAVSDSIGDVAPHFAQFLSSSYVF